jgi:hypothetical protein
VTATQNNTTIVNSLSSETGTALRVVQTQIGAAGLTFRRIDANGGSDTGVILDQTGLGVQNGGLTVTGAGTAGSGGRIAQKTGPDGSTSEGVGLYLNSTKAPSLNRLQLDNFSNAAIIGRNVAGFTLADSIIEGTVGSTVGINEGPLVFGLPNPGGVNGATGTVTLTNSAITGGVEDNAVFYNQTGTVNLVVERTSPTPGDCRFGENSAVTGGAGLRVLTEGAAIATVTINQCRFRKNSQTSVVGTATGDSSLTLSIAGSEIVRDVQGLQGVVLTNAGNADLTAVVTDNDFSFFPMGAVHVGQAAGNATAQSMLRATISGNRIDSGPNALGAAITARLSSTVGQVSQSRLLLADNGTGVPRIEQHGLPPGILISTPDPGTTPNVDVTLTSNHVDMHETDSGTGVRGPYGIHLNFTQGSACSNLLNNISHWFPIDVGPGGDMHLEQSGSATVSLERGAAALGTPPAEVLALQNSEPTSVAGTVAVVENGSCVLPSAP